MLAKVIAVVVLTMIISTFEMTRSWSIPFFVVALEGRTRPDAVGDTPHAWVRLGAAGKALKLLRREKVEELVLAGPVSRPTLAELKPDLWAAKFLAKKGKQVFDDDNGLLGALIREMEETEGFRVLQPETLLANP